MLKLIQTEFIKLRRRTFIWLMFAAAFVTPILALLYYKSGVDPKLFYKMSAFGFASYVILPFVLGVLCTMLMYDENQNDMLKQLWIVPVSKMGYFFSKFLIIVIYSIFFMLITAVASILFSVLSGYVTFEWGNVFYLLQKCLEIGVLTAFAMMPILAIAASQKGYILPVCLTLVYLIFGFFVMGINSYIHPIASVSVLINRNNDIPGIPFAQANIPLALFCIGVWGLASVLLVNTSLGKGK